MVRASGFFCLRHAQVVVPALHVIRTCLIAVPEAVLGSVLLRTLNGGSEYY